MGKVRHIGRHVQKEAVSSAVLSSSGKLVTGEHGPRTLPELARSYLTMLASVRRPENWAQRRLTPPCHRPMVIEFSLTVECYFFLTVRVAGFSVSPPLALSKASESLALNGYRRTDCCPVVLRETSTRRLLAQTIICKWLSILPRSSGVRSGFSSTNCFTWSAVRLSSSPTALVSMFDAGTPCSTRKLLVRFTRRSVSFWLYS